MAEPDDGLAHLIGCHRRQCDTSSRKRQSFRFWEVVSPRAVMAFRLLIRSASFGADLPAQARFFCGLCVFRKGFGSVLPFSRSRMRSLVFVFFPERLRFWSLCFQQINLHFVFVFSVFCKNPDFSAFGFFISAAGGRSDRHSRQIGHFHRYSFSFS